MCFADGLGATIAGTLTPVSRISADYAAEVWGGDQATILRHDRRAAACTGCAPAWPARPSPTPTRPTASTWTTARVTPMAMPARRSSRRRWPSAEALDRTGAEMLTAMVVGYEVAHRIGRCWHASRDVYQACGSWGSVACAAATANLMRLTPEQAGHALGIAEYHAGNLPMMRDVDDPGMVKHGIGWGAMTGVTAAGLATRGYTGIPTLLAFPEYQDWACDIGRNYLMVEGVAWKPARYACCGWAHAGVEGARRLVQEHAIDLDDIARIVVAGSTEHRTAGHATADHHRGSAVQPGLAVGRHAGGWRDRPRADAGGAAVRSAASERWLRR